MKLKSALLILFLCQIQISCAQTEPTTDTSATTYRALAKFISFQGGDKIHSATFKIIKTLSDTLRITDTITISYYNYKLPESDIDTVLLTLHKHYSDPSINNHFYCINYDGKTNIRKVKIDYISDAHWENCEKGNTHCKPLIFTRNKNIENWFLIMPCGGTETSITIKGQNFEKELHLYHNACPPYLELTNLPDGKYFAHMRACGLGGTVKFSLITK